MTATTEEIISSSRKLMKSVRANLTQGGVGGNISGHPDNPCCPSCERMYESLMEAEQTIGTSAT